MSDPRVEKLADVLVNYSVAIRPGDRVLIQGSPIAEPLLKATLVKVLQAGGYPLSFVRLPGMNALTFQHSSDEQLKHVPEPLKIAVETYDASISLMSSENTKALTNVPPEKMVLSSQAQRDIMKTVMQRSAKGEFRWVGTLYPTNAYAQDAEMSLSEYEDFVYGACLPEMDDPVGYWKSFSLWQQKIVDWLAGKETIRVAGPDVDLRMRISDRVFINCDGKKNMPDGEVFTGPVETAVNGQVRFTYPACYRGREVEEVRLWFENGQVVKATASKNEAFLHTMLDTDEGARRLGEFAFGLNPGIQRFTKNILFDEKIGGTVHMALGAAYPETGGVNHSAIHWDMICDLRRGGEVYVDGVLFAKDGEVVI